MMAELIRASLFCDTDDMYLDETTAGPDTISSVLTMSRVNPRDSESSSPTSSTPSSTTPTCNGVTLSLNYCYEYWSSINNMAKVDLSTFKNVAADEIFGNDYLTQIASKPVSTKATSKSIIKSQIFGNDYLTQIASKHVSTKAASKSIVKSQNLVKSHLIYQYDDVKVFRPPYTYPALAIAAIYMSGSETLTVQCVIEQFGNMFDAFKIECLKWEKTWKHNVHNTLASLKYLYKTSNGRYGVKPGQIDRTVMLRKFIGQRGDNDQYAKTLHDQLGAPTMLEDIQLGRRKRKSNVSQYVMKTMDDNRTDLMTENLKTRSTADDTHVTASSLRLPPRPCFHDENSTDELCGTMDKTSSARNDTSKTQGNDSGYEEFKQGLGTPLQKISVAPTPLPPITAFIPCSATSIIQFMDVCVNGQIVSVPVQLNGGWL